MRLHLEVARRDELKLAANDLEQRRVDAAGDQEVVGPPTVSASVAVSVTTAVVFSATLGVADEVNTGALSLMSVSVTVRFCTVLFVPSFAVTSTA